MGIYLPDMEMPKDGAFVEVLIWSDGHVTQTGDSYFAEDGRAYYQPCDWKYFSAVPVPKHGRLIDGDRAEKELAFDYAYAAAKMVKEMPTVIPASEEAKDGSIS